MLNEISNLLLIIYVFFAILLGVILMLKSNTKRPTFLLGLFVLVYSAEDMSILGDIYLSESKLEKIFNLPFFHFAFLAAPVLYLYSKNLISTISWKLERIHLIPGIIEFLFFTVLFFFNTETNNWIADLTANHWFITYALFFTFNFFYYYKTYKFITKCKHEVQNFYSTVNGKLLLWIKNIVISLLIVAFIWIGSNTLSAFINEEYANVILPYLRLTLDVANLCLILYITYMGLKQVALLEFSQMKLEESSFIGDKNVIANHTTLNENNQFYDRILEYMEEKEPFTDSNLTLATLASGLNTQTRKLSTAIKQETSYNFNQFINKLRVEKSKELLISPQYSHYTILGIAEEAGFNSKATFNTSFKQFVKMTPSQYKKQF